MADFWVFGYGSLIWRPGFPFVERTPARLLGAHRSLCVYSWVHRGTQDHPGLVLGLDRGGTCRGLAFRVDPEERENVVAYLREREQVTAVYQERIRPILLDDGRRADALTYLVDRGHPQYAGKLDADQQLGIVEAAHGRSGPNREYVINTAVHLAELGMPDARLSWIAAKLDGAGQG